MTSETPSTADHEPDPTPGDRPSSSRRNFLGMLGAGVGAAVAAPAIASAQTDEPPRRPSTRRRPRRTRDGRAAVPAAWDGPDRRARPRRAVRRSGPFRADVRPARLRPPEGRAARSADRDGSARRDDGRHDPLEVGPVRLITEPELSPNNRDNPTTPRASRSWASSSTTTSPAMPGRGSAVRRRSGAAPTCAAPASTSTASTAAGPTSHPSCTTGSASASSPAGSFEDLPRDDDGLAILGDDRNDENIMLAGLQCAFLMFHNAVLDDISGRDPTAADFDAAARLVRRHYQWIIVHEVLPQFVGQAMVDDVIANGRRFYTPHVPAIPLEFQTSAYRFGHSMIRPSYRANLAGDDGEPFFAFVFDPDDVRQTTRRPDRAVPGAAPVHRLADVLRLRRRRGQAEQAHRHRDVDPAVPAADVRDPERPGRRRRADLARHAQPAAPHHVGDPVRPADRRRDGRRPLAPATSADVGQLGPTSTARRRCSTTSCARPTSSTTVCTSDRSVAASSPRCSSACWRWTRRATSTPTAAWRPTLPQRDGSAGDDFTMADLLTIAGVDPDSRGQ